MLIRIKYIDNRYDMVRPELLDHLLKMGTVAEFMRRDGWVAGSSGAVRSNGAAGFSGMERREKRSLQFRDPEHTRRNVGSDGF